MFALGKEVACCILFFYEKTIDAEAKPKLIRPMRTTPSAYVPQILGKSLYSPNDVTDNWENFYELLGFTQ